MNKIILGKKQKDVLMKMSILFVLIGITPSLIQAKSDIGRLQQERRLLSEQIFDLQNQLSKLRSGQGVEPSVWGPALPESCQGISFTRNLLLGMTGPDVKCLQSILNLHEDTKVSLYGNGSPGNETYYFGQKTQDAVVKFQNKYRDEILSPYGIYYGTGYVGSFTMDKLNEKLNEILTGAGTTKTNCTALECAGGWYTYLTGDGRCDVSEDPHSNCWECINDNGVSGHFCPSGQLCNVNACDSTAGTCTDEVSECQSVEKCICDGQRQKCCEYHAMNCPSHCPGVECRTYRDKTLNVYTDFDGNPIGCNKTVQLDVHPGKGSMVWYSGPCEPSLDLTVTDISRDNNYYRVKYCNEGDAMSDNTFTILLTNLTDNKSFESSHYYPYSVPTPGECKWTGGFTCGLIGDPTCDKDIQVKVIIDYRNTVDETDENNNTYQKDFGGSLTVLSPNGGEKWEIGETYDIKWDSQGIDKEFQVMLRWGSGDSPAGMIIAKNLPSTTKSHSWTIPSFVDERDDYRVSVQAMEGMSVPTIDFSDDYFSIVEKDCHTSPLWSWGYCSEDCKCYEGEGDCDRDSDCHTGYCAQNVGVKYGQHWSIDVCEEEVECKQNNDCAWCGRSCIPYEKDMYCPTISPPVGYVCVCENGECTEVKRE